MTKINILVSGSQGQVGQEIKEASEQYPDFNFTFTTRQELDLDDEESIKRVFENGNFDFFINAAAYTAVDKAETETALSFAINGMALFHIMNYMPTSCQLIHISSDYVYHNHTKLPIKENDPCCPKGIYAQSKLQGDGFVLASEKKAIILRTSWVYSTFGNNFVKTMLRLGREKDKLTIVNDQIGAPTNAKDISQAILHVIKTINAGKTDYSGIYNFCNKGQTNWAAFAETIFKLKGIECPITTTTTEAYNAPASRPLWSVLSTEKIQKTFGLEIRNWEESLKECLSKLP